MFIVGLFTWWYGAGWKKVSQILLQKLVATEDFFSIDMLLRSIFAPFKQISAGSGSGGTLQMKLQAWFDKQFSRFIGALIRLTLILVGSVWLILQVCADVVILALWPLVPIAPIIGLVLALAGVTL